MKVVTAEQMRVIDERTIHDLGISADDLMLQAGRAMAEIARAQFAPARVAIVCGKGNNAGDGFVVARELACDGIEVDVLLMEPRESYTGAAENALARLGDTRARIHNVDENSLEPLRGADLIIDALVGTGIRGPLRDRYAKAAEIINLARRPVLCVDVPSGLGDYSSADDAHIVRGTVTVTIGLPKQSLLSTAGIAHAGDVVVAPIQFPAELTNDPQLTLNWAPNVELKSWLPARAADSNKGNFGHVGVVAGSAPYAGAAILVARGALRAGCGLVTIFCTAEINPIFKVALPEATSVIVPSQSGGFLDGTSASAITDHAERLSVLAVGPGLGTDQGQHALLRYLLQACKRPMVIDADAISLLAKDVALLLRLRVLRDCVLTPHPGEMGRLLGRSAGEVQAGRNGALAEAVQRTGVTVALKGASTLIGKPDGQTWMIRGGTSALAKGGTGDVLTGVIASLMAQGLAGWQAALIAASAHVQAGIACARDHGERGVLASEVADYIPRIMDRW